MRAFWSPLDSHYSQTYGLTTSSPSSFGALWIHTTLKPGLYKWHGVEGFGALWIHTTLKRLSPYQSPPICFGALWIHTTLKHIVSKNQNLPGFGALWIHTTLKPTFAPRSPPGVLEPSGFTLLSNSRSSVSQSCLFWSPLDSHYSQTAVSFFPSVIVFWSPLDSHYSQTLEFHQCSGCWFWSPLDSHYSQTLSSTTFPMICFGALWIHTTLKL